MKNEHDWMKKYDFWINNKNLNLEMLNELIHLKEDEIESRFNSSLEFGTAGMRGLLGVGTNRLNVHTVSQFAEGLSLRLLKENEPKIVIGYDVRHCSKNFAHLISGILSRNNIKVHLFKEISPTPLLSYAIRSLNATGGIMITASHNPKEYNGCKVYWSDGAQITSELAEEIVECINNVNSFEVNYNKKEKLITPVKSEIINSYMNKISKLSFKNEKKIINVVYSPLNGCGSKYVEEILKHKGYTIEIVREQRDPDPDFTTIHSPNPENIEAFEYSINVGLKNKADLLLVTDPDADRVGVMIWNGEKYVQIDGNMLGSLMVNYILSSLGSLNMLNRKLKVVTTIATSDLGRKIALNYGIETIQTHVGFKNIYSLLNQWNNDDNKFVLGYEESCGFGIGPDIARDKDAISSSMLISEMVNHYKLNGKNLIEVYEDLQSEYGYHYEETISIQTGGLKAQKEIENIMHFFRKHGFSMNDQSSFKIDYLKDNTGLEKVDAIEVTYENGTRYLIRPSGTEPKLKIYIYSVSRNKEESLNNFNILKNKINEVINDFSITKN